MSCIYCNGLFIPYIVLYVYCLYLGSFLVFLTLRQFHIQCVYTHIIG